MTSLPLVIPAGKALDALARESRSDHRFRVKLNRCSFSLSGVENQVKAMAERGEAPADIARFALNTVADAVARATTAALEEYPGLNVLCSGGVASNTLLREKLKGAVFAEPRYSTDNAMGVAILAWRSLRAGENGR